MNPSDSSLPASPALPREEDRELALLSENFPEGALYQYVAHPDGRQLITYLGRGAERLFGALPPQLPVDISWLTRHLDPRDAVAMAVTGQHAHLTFSPFSHEARVRTDDGTERWVSFRTKPRYGSDGRTVWDGVIIDITARRRAEAAVQRQVEFLAALNQTTLELVGRRNVAELLSALVARASTLLRSPHAEISLLEGGELVVRAFSPGLDYLAGDRVPRSAHALSWRAIESRSPVVVTDYAKAPEHRPVYRDHDVRSAAVFPILREDECVGVLGLARSHPDEPFSADEIQEGLLLARMAALVLHNAAVHEDALREAETRTTALRESEQRFRGVFDQSPVIIALLTVPEGRIVEMNAAALVGFGCTREEGVGKTSVELNLWVDLAERERYLNLLRTEHAVSGFEARMRRKNGEIFTVLYSGSFITIEGRPYSLNILQDISARKSSEAALGESEERFRAVFDESPIGVGLFALPAGRIDELNATALALFGFAREEIIGRSTLELNVWVEAADRDRYVQRLIKDGSVREFETVLRRKDGSFVHVLFSGSLVTLSGQPYSLSTVQDITARKQSEAARDRSFALTRATLESSADGILVVNAEGRIDTFNRNFVELWHLTATSPDLPFNEDHIIRSILAQLALPENFLLGLRDLYAGSEDEVFDLLHCLDGRVFERYSRPQLLNNRPAGRVWSFREITDRLAAEAALRQSEERFRVLAEVSPVGIFSSDPAGRTTFVNRRWCELAGLTPAEALGEGWIRALHPDDRARVADSWSEAVRTGESSAAEFRFVRPDDTVCYLVGQSRAHRRTDGTLAGYVGTITDVTRLKRAEEEQKNIEAQLRQSRKMESLGTLAGGIAHDFNNILNGTFGFVDLARLDLAPGHPVHTWLDRIAASSQRARELVRQILTFSRKNEGTRVVQRLPPVITEALRLLRASLPAMVELRSHLAADAPAVLVDSTQIHQVVLNLGTNAWHALPERGGHIIVTLEACNIDAALAHANPELTVGPAARLTVFDNGSGMDATTLDHIFEPFFTTKETGAGTGLGLAVVHGIVKSHQGAIVVRSTVGAGSTFEIYLPAAAAEPVKTVTPPTEIPRGHGERVLVVDDDAVSGFVIEKLVESLGYSVSRCTRPEEALARFSAAPSSYDLVVSDLAMPGMNGEELIGHLAQIRPDLPIIVASGFLENARQRILDKGIARAVLNKPVPRNELAFALAHALAR